MTETSPRIYYLHPLLAGPLARWDRNFAHAARLGFDSVMIAPPFRAGRGADLFRVADHHWLDDRLGGGEAAPALRQAAAAAAAEGIRLLLDIPVTHVAADSALVRERPHCFATLPPDALPDPRRPPGRQDEALWRFDAYGEEVLRWWGERLRAWQDCGIAGVRFRGTQAAPAWWWRRLLGDEAPGGIAIADITGAAPAALDALAGCGFSLAAGAAGWWDGRAIRLGEEAAARAVVAPAVAMTEVPFGPRVAAGGRDAAEAAQLSRRALGFAAFDGAAWLMPMGFEYGAVRRMDPARDTPDDFASLAAAPRYDLAPLITAANQRRTLLPPLWSSTGARLISPPDAPVAVLLRAHHADAADAVLLLANPSLTQPARLEAASLLPELGGLFTGFASADGLAESLAAGGAVNLPPAGLRVLRAITAPPVCLPAPAADSAAAAARAPRIAIEKVTPDVDAGRFPVKRVVGEVVRVEADIICDGHDKLAAALHWRTADSPAWQEVRMTDLGNDRWTASFPLARLGRHQFTVIAWKDAFATFAYELDKKHQAGLGLTLELEEGRRLLAAAGVRDLAERLAPADDTERLAVLRDPATRRLMEAADPRAHLVRHAPDVLVDAERQIARFASWYEMFPRSAVNDGQTHGGFTDVLARLADIAAMGFDVLYFPPIHPIGRVNRKGRNNTLTPAPDDPGSPYAIGSAEGGHDALHPQLGTIEDFRRLRAAAAAQGLELALDFAIQCAPDHPWLRAHPEWFDWRPDGSIRYAENPPKKYEDIVNVDFYAAGAIPSLWLALRDVVLFWVGEGVRIFRVDNPHTKPLPFWEWLIGEVRGAHPDCIFLAEAFTKPKMMYRLAKLGFSQSYTYFTWRNTKYELTEYLSELATTAPADFFRPNFFVNTPDINPPFLQHGGRPAHLIRAALAGTLSGLWGMYNGFEICEATPLPGREEYLDSEKYQLRSFDWKRPGNIIAEITRLNRIRRANPALHTHLGVSFHTAWNDQVLLFSKATAARDNLVLVAVNLDPFRPQEAEIDLPLWQWGLADDALLQMEDLMRDTGFVWRGRRQRVRLDPADLPFAIWRVRLT